jgi:hypothetical protein
MRILGNSAASISISASSTANLGSKGTSSAVVSLSAAGSGQQLTSGSSQAIIAISGAGAGRQLNAGQSASSITITGAAAGNHGVAGQSSSSFTPIGSAAGIFSNAQINGVSDATITISGTAYGGECLVSANRVYSEVSDPRNAQLTSKIRKYNLTSDHV